MTFLEFQAAVYLRNAWIQEGQVRCYMRKSKRYFPATGTDKSSSYQIIECLDVATIEVTGPHNQGLCTSFLQHLLAVQSHRVYIENIINPILSRLAKKLGFVVDDRPGMLPEIPNMWKDPVLH